MQGETMKTVIMMFGLIGKKKDEHYLEKMNEEENFDFFSMLISIR